MKDNTSDKYVIKRRLYFYAPALHAPSSVSYFSGAGDKTFDWDGCGVDREEATELSKSEAEALVARLDACPYERQPWEYARPKYTIELA